jgi:hypothetical protein
MNAYSQQVPIMPLIGCRECAERKTMRRRIGARERNTIPPQMHEGFYIITWQQMLCPSKKKVFASKSSPETEINLFS